MRKEIDRTCIVTRSAGTADELIRFVAAPDGAVMADTKQNLPGRGCWVTGDRASIDEAVKRKLFGRNLKEDVTVSPTLGADVDQLLVKNFLGTLGLARKAGQLLTGAAKVESALRGAEAILVLHAFEAADDGVRKMDQARKAVAMTGGPVIPAFKLLSSVEMDLALGGGNVIHVAVLKGSAGFGLAKRARALAHYRGLKDDTEALKIERAAKETE